jgi:hypothetical protein
MECIYEGIVFDITQIWKFLLEIITLISSVIILGSDKVFVVGGR